MTLRGEEEVKMYRHFSFLIFALFCSIVQSKSLSDPLNLRRWTYHVKAPSDDYVTGSMWPKPQRQSPTGVKFSLMPKSFTFQINGKTSAVLTQAVQRYKAITFPDADGSKAAPNLDVIESLEIKVLGDYKNLTLESDESYALVVNAPKSVLTAYEVWGALRGLETFSQVVYQDENNLYYAKENKIVDYPRFRYRGMLMDSSRHYLKLPVIYKFLDAMSYGKMNILHWHIVDAEAFPYHSEMFPQLSGKGSFNNKTHIYTADDISKVIEYARLRGIMVIPEFDTPGHTTSWQSIENFLTKCYKGGKPDGTLGPVDPTVESNYEFLEKFFTEVTHRFNDKYIHLGGDEVNQDCWKSNPNIAAWMKQHGMEGNYSMLNQYYSQRLVDIVASLDKEYVVWQDVVDNPVKVLHDTIIDVWRPGSDHGWQPEMARVTGKLGLKAVLSSCWYLDLISYGQDWPKYYNCEPTGFNGTDAQKKLVIGGHGSIWAEWADGTNIFSRTWPRALAVAERLWSSKDTTDLTDASMRIWEHRCRYLLRGIPAENAIEAKYCRNEWPVNM